VIYDSLDVIKQEVNTPTAYKKDGFLPLSFDFLEIRAMKPETDMRSCAGRHVGILQTWFIKVVVCMILCSLTPLYYAQADQLCGRGDTLNVMDGEYRVHNNVWGSTPGAQCINVYPDSTYFSVTLSDHNATGVQAYPFILKGCHWSNSDCTLSSGMPIKVSEINTAPFIWSVDPNGATGSWNISYESWFSKTNDGSNYHDGAELMIWLRWNGGTSPAGSYVGTVSIGGYSWYVYHLSPVPWGDWEHYIAYRITTPVNYVKLDLKNFIDDANSRGYIQPSWYLDNMEAGFELTKGGQWLTSKSFAGLINEKFSVNFIDFAYFANEWLRTDCTGANDWCDGADYPPEDGKVNFYDLKKFADYWLAE